MEWVKYVAKALYAGAVAFLTAVGAILVGDVGFGDITAGQWVAIALGVVIALGGVFKLKNGDKPA
jgi:hypothetical protein